MKRITDSNLSMQ